MREYRWALFPGAEALELVVGDEQPVAVFADRDLALRMGRMFYGAAARVDEVVSDGGSERMAAGEQAGQAQTGGL